MKIPKTSSDEPYIEFRFNKNGKIKLSATSIWWGGKNSGFISSDGTQGNTCKPKDLDSYLKVYKEKRIKSLEKEVANLQKQIDKLKSVWYY
jgi:hypothetical protein